MKALEAPNGLLEPLLVVSSGSVWEFFFYLGARWGVPKVLEGVVNWKWPSRVINNNSRDTISILHPPLALLTSFAFFSHAIACRNAPPPLRVFPPRCRVPGALLLDIRFRSTLPGPRGIVS